MLLHLHRMMASAMWVGVAPGGHEEEQGGVQPWAPEGLWEGLGGGQGPAEPRHLWDARGAQPWPLWEPGQLAEMLLKPS